MVFTVGEMAKLLGVPTSTLRYYDKEGLLPFVERSPGGMRLFQEKDYEWLQVIECLKKTGMPLKDIRVYVDMAMRGDSTSSSGRLFWHRWQTCKRPWTPWSSSAGIMKRQSRQARPLCPATCQWRKFRSNTGPPGLL